MAKEALVVIDMLRDFVEKGAPLEVPSARAIVPHLQKRIQEARQRGAAIIYVCDAHRVDDEEFAKWPPHALEGTRGAEVIDEIKPHREDFLVHKRRYSAFLGTDLELLLRELKVEKIYITGVLTNICVFFTAFEASTRNYEVVIWVDSVAALSVNDHQFALDQMRRVLKVRIEE